ncbi:methyl-accepting chemotaxis protein [Noviherbaspirillum aridicola]|uniref:Methyl-accepting chemotaxis protein n=1 Tax=Noviherbaspirillum aridicola TaxID=2849687 RepID=A0ABQ4Q687_9BURK|nr:methyl-accepting chemotaxis protein [Noviherbaspirillum aridicola]GIZ52633.1 methyl-accepting chemotaxis protein [Noviherbaspirillum aridicola]
MKWSFRKKLFAPLVIAWISLWAITLTDMYSNKVRRLEERQLSLRYATQIGLSVVQEYAALAAAGKMSVEEAQKQALARVKAMRFGEDGYLTVISSRAAVVMHPLKPELDGKDMGDYKDPAGNYLFRDMAAIAKGKGEGWVEYVWPKPGHPDQSKVFPKGSYVLTYKPWDWSFVTGVYLDDLTDALISDFWRAFLMLTIVGIFLNGSILLVIRSVERSIGGDPDDAAEVARRIAGGDLTSPVVLRKNDGGSLLSAMKTMQDSLLGIVSQVRSGTESISTASGQIAAGNLDLSSRTEQQAASLEETASSMEELTSTVRQNAENARQANQMAIAASEVAGKGGEVVHQVVETMSEINASAGKIVDIIGVIDGIAFQTNILALNAAVEAARAGEQGRGFAVVAAEVRTLAQRSASAAREIKELIGNSVQKVNDGSALVDQAGATMQDVVASVRRVADLIGEIAAASDEQTAGIEQVNQAIAQMDQVTQQNAALVEEAAAASDSMQKQAKELAESVSVFKLSTGGDAAPAPVRAPRQPTAARPAPAARSSVPARRPAAPPAPASAPARASLPVAAGDDWDEF